MWIFAFLVQVSLGLVHDEPGWFVCAVNQAIPIEVPTEAAPELPAGQTIVVSLKDQMLRAYKDGELVYEFECSTGRNNATPSGDWPIRQKVLNNRALPEYGSVPIPFSLRLDIVKNGRRHLIAIHAHKSVPRKPASHGCIRLHKADAKKLYSWAKIGTVVSVVSKASPELTARSIARAKPAPAPSVHQR